MDQRRIEEGLERRIEALITSWSNLQDMERQLQEFSDNNSAPEPPPRFDSVGALIEYDQRKRRYEEQLEGHHRRVGERRRAFENEGRAFLSLLPEGVPLVHTYETYGSSVAGRTYEILRVESEEQPTIQVRDVTA